MQGLVNYNDQMASDSGSGKGVEYYGRRTVRVEAPFLVVCERSSFTLFTEGSNERTYRPREKTTQGRETEG